MAQIVFGKKSDFKFHPQVVIRSGMRQGQLQDAGPAERMRRTHMQLGYAASLAIAHLLSVSRPSKLQSRKVRGKVPRQAQKARCRRTGLYDGIDCRAACQSVHMMNIRECLRFLTCTIPETRRHALTDWEDAEGGRYWQLG